MEKISKLSCGLIVAKDKSLDEIGGDGGWGGWDEAWGQEIIEREIIPRTKKGDVVLDLGSGLGRASMTFAMRGFEVIAVDLNQGLLGEADSLRRRAGARKAINMPIDMRSLNPDKFLDRRVSVIIASDACNHMTKSEADRFIEFLPKLLSRERGGLLYLDVPSAEGFFFECPEYFGAWRADNKTIMKICGCSGELKEEPIPFYEDGELMARVAFLGGNILRTGKLYRDENTVMQEVVAKFSPKS